MTYNGKSIVKISLLPLDCDIDTKIITYLNGIVGKLIPTLGLAEFTIFRYAKSSQIVSEGFLIPCKGILGFKYFKKLFPMLDFGLRLLKIGENDSRFKDGKPTNQNWNKKEVEKFNSSSETEENSKEGHEIFSIFKDQFNFGEEYDLFIAVFVLFMYI